MKQFKVIQPAFDAVFDESEIHAHADQRAIDKFEVLAVGDTLVDEDGNTWERIA